MYSRIPRVSLVLLLLLTLLGGCGQKGSLYLPPSDDHSRTE